MSVPGGLSLKTGTLIAALLLAVLSLSSLDVKLRLQDDSGIYISLAKSLSSGQGYREIYFIDSPYHEQYPPVFPLLLAPAIRLLGPDFLVMKLLLLALAVLALFPLSALCRDLSDARLAVQVVLLTATTHGVVFFTQSIMSEIPYLFLSLLALFWVHRCARSGAWTAGGVAAAAALIGLTYLCRLIGLSLLVATVLYLVVDGSGRLRARVRFAAVIGGLGAIPLALWLLYNWWAGHHVATTSYLKYYSSFLGQASSAPTGSAGIVTLLWKIYMALSSYAVHAGNVVVYFTPSAPLGRLLALVPAAIALAGFLRCALRRRTILEYYVFLYVCALLVFPGSRQQRYIVPLIPFIWYYFLTAAGHLIRWLPDRRPALEPRRRREKVSVAGAVVAALLIANVAVSAAVNVVWRGKGYYEGTGSERYREVLSWVKAHTASDSVFMWPRPSLGYLLAERRAVTVPGNKPETILRVLHEAKVDYVVVHPAWKASGGLHQLVERYPQHLRLVHRNQTVGVYRVVDPGSE